MSLLNINKRLNDNIKGHNVYCLKTKKNLGVVVRVFHTGPDNVLLEYKTQDDKLFGINMRNAVIDYSEDNTLTTNFRPYKWAMLNATLLGATLNYDTRSYDIAYSVDCLLDLYTTTNVMLTEMTNNYDSTYIEDEWLQPLWNDAKFPIISPKNNLYKILEISEVEMSRIGHRSIFSKYGMVVSSTTKDFREFDKKIYHQDDKTHIWISIKIDDAKWEDMVADAK